jgi:hypothetical protein
MKRDENGENCILKIKSKWIRGWDGQSIQRGCEQEDCMYDIGGKARRKETARKTEM